MNNFIQFACEHAAYQILRYCDFTKIRDLLKALLTASAIEKCITENENWLNLNKSANI